jgi:predicted RNA polymerase sigma factor
VLRRDDVRLAVVAALQHLAPKQRAVLLLHDVCGLSLAEAASTIGTNANAAKATLQRARAALDRTRGRADVDVPVDIDVVERLARALESRSVDALAALLADDDGLDDAATQTTAGLLALPYQRIASRTSARIASKESTRISPRRGYSRSIVT